MFVGLEFERGIFSYFGFNLVVLSSDPSCILSKAAEVAAVKGELTAAGLLEDDWVIEEINLDFFPLCFFCDLLVVVVEALL
jgi:hypothetical protein